MGTRFTVHIIKELPPATSQAELHVLEAQEIKDCKDKGTLYYNHLEVHPKEPTSEYALICENANSKAKIGGTMSKKQTQWSRAYNEKAYDQIAVTVPKGMRSRIALFAQSEGTSVNGLVNVLLRTHMGLSVEEWKGCNNASNGENEKYPKKE